MWCAPLAVVGGLMLPPPTTADRLVVQLGDPEYRTREAAAKRLLELGRPALAPLAAATRSDSPEVADRAARLIPDIRRRLDTEAALAPTVVELPGGEQTVRQVFDAIEKQTRYRLLIDGDQTALAKTLKLPPGKRPFWEAVRQVGDTAGLEVVSVGSLGTLVVPRVTTTGVRDNVPKQYIAYATSRLILSRKGLDHHRGQIAKHTEQAKEAKGAEKIRLDGLIADGKRQVEEYEKLIAEIEGKYGLKVHGPTQLGTIELHPKAAKGSAPTSVAGAVRVTAGPVPVEERRQHPADLLPLAVTVFPEPRLNWQWVTEVSILEAVGPDGRPLRPAYFRPPPTTLANDELQFRRARLGLRDDEPLPPTRGNTGTAFLAAQGSAADRAGVTLKSVRGLVRGRVWTEPGEIVAVRGLKAGEEITADGPNGVRLGVTVLDPVRGEVLVTLRYDPAEVRPESNGLTVHGVDGKPVRLTPVSQRVSETRIGSRRVTEVQTRYQYVPEKGEAAPQIGGVSVRGSRLADVTVPFQLSDVPVTPGDKPPPPK